MGSRASFLVAVCVLFSSLGAVLDQCLAALPQSRTGDCAETVHGRECDLADEPESEKLPVEDWLEIANRKGVDHGFC